ncbi:transmembrane protein 59 [Arapaima gigas]
MKRQGFWMSVASLCSLLLCPDASADVFDGVLGNTASCHKTCQLTYSLHTYPREEELYACQRGCRLFSICQFVGEGQDLNQTKSECDSACHEAYIQTDEQYACSLGCQNQLPFAEERQEQLLAMMPRIHLLYPLALVRGFWNDVMSSAHNFISSSWTFYLQADDGKVIVFQTEPQIQLIPQFVLQREDIREQPENPVYNDYQQPFIQERDKDISKDQGDSGSDYSLFSCLSRNPWLPGWILTMTLVLSTLVLIWICCATVATAVDQYVPAEKLSIYGDLEYIKDQKLIPYPASSLVVISSTAEEEAGPLPSKIRVDQSNI